MCFVFKVAEALPQIWDIAASLNAVEHQGRYGAVFGSYGWSGEGVANIDQRLQQVRINMPLDPLKLVTGC